MMCVERQAHPTLFCCYCYSGDKSKTASPKGPHLARQMTLCERTVSYVVPEGAVTGSAGAFIVATQTSLVAIPECIPLIRAMTEH